MDERTKTDYLVTFHRSQIDMLLKRKRGSDDERPLKEKIKEIAKEVAEFSLINGVSSIVRNECYIKVTWILCHICLIGIAFTNPFLLYEYKTMCMLKRVSGLTIFLTINNIFSYLKYDVITKVREVNELPMEFPVVTLCNINLFQTNYSIQYLREVGRLYNYTDIFNSTDAYNEYYSYDLTNNYSYAGYASVFVNDLNKTEIQKFSFSLDQMLLWCQFNLESCNSSDFGWFFHPEYGLVT